ncbi:hypothetical protein CE91St41_26790 [Oscillospiraceae bacterium]|nr:hypothetical protein CE91St40_10750 [Oscillospiraceae bacterium]BDF75790.1 hypothetical protein CE91St41_26790 [Oscillospiraceae bacterium]
MTMKREEIRLPRPYTPPTTRDEIVAAIAHRHRMIAMMYRSSEPGSVVRVNGIGRARAELRTLYHALGVLDELEESV